MRAPCEARPMIRNEEVPVLRGGHQAAGRRLPVLRARPSCRRPVQGPADPPPSDIRVVCLPCHSRIAPGRRYFRSRMRCRLPPSPHHRAARSAASPTAAGPCAAPLASLLRTSSIIVIVSEGPQRGAGCGTLRTLPALGSAVLAARQVPTSTKASIFFGLPLLSNEISGLMLPVATGRKAGAQATTAADRWADRHVFTAREWCPQRNSNPCCRLERPVS